MSSNNDNKIKAYYYGFNEKPMEIRKKCETNYYLKTKDLTTFDIGVYSSVAEVCIQSNCKYIVKVSTLNDKNIYQTFLREALIAPLMAKHKIGPKIFDIFICLNTGYIIMEKWDGTVKNIINELTEDHLHTLAKLLNKMHKYGVIHNDLHTANILYRITKDNKYEFSYTDYGLSLYFENKNEIIPKNFLPNNKSPNTFFPAFDFHRINNALESRNDEIFNAFFFNNGYISLLDYILVDKYYTKKKNINDNFYEYITNINIDQHKIILSNEYLMSFNNNQYSNKTGYKKILKNINSKKNRSNTNTNSKKNRYNTSANSKKNRYNKSANSKKNRYNTSANSKTSNSGNNKNSKNKENYNKDINL